MKYLGSFDQKKNSTKTKKSIELVEVDAKINLVFSVRTITVLNIL